MAGKIKQIQAAIGECFRSNPGSLTRAQVVAWIGLHFPEANFNQGTISAQLYRSCANVPSAMKYSAPKILIFDSHTRTYRLATETQLSALAPPTENFDEEEGENESEADASSTFALESHLRDYLAGNLQLIENGLTLWSNSPPSVEYPVSGRRIDILARDRDSVPVVIELKLSRGHDRVIGQALFYKNSLLEQLKTPRVRVILIAGEISSELRIASRDMPDIQLFEYSLSMQLKSISPSVLED